MPTTNALEYLQMQGYSTDEIKVECAIQDITINDLTQQVFDSHEADLEKDTYLNPTFA